MTGESASRDRKTVGPTAAPSDGESDGDDPTAEEALDRIRDRATDVRDRQVETALDELDRESDLTANQRAAVERLADGIVDRLLAVPERGPDAGDTEATGVDRETVETALELFGQR